MKWAPLSLFLPLALGAAQAFAEAKDPLVGAWEVIYGQYGLPDAPVEVRQLTPPVQLKVFGAGRFAYVRHNPDGSFLAASAGSYEIDGDRYIETTQWSSEATSLGTRVTFTFYVVGETVCISGPLEVRDSRGQRVEGLPRMKELMRRAGGGATALAACLEGAPARPGPDPGGRRRPREH